MTKNEVYDLVNKYRCPRDSSVEPVTDQLIRVGELLVQQCLDLTTALETKGNSLLGFVGVTVAFVLGQARWLAGLDSVERFLIAVAAASACFAGGAAAVTIWPVGWAWFSDENWIVEAYLESPDELARHHLLKMHEIVSQHTAINRRKGTALVWSQRAFMLAVALYFLVVVCNGLPFADGAACGTPTPAPG